MDNLKMISEPIDINRDFNKMLKIFKDLIDSAYVPDGSSKKETKALKEVKDTTNEFIERVNLLTVIEQLKLLGFNTNTCSKLRKSLKGPISKYAKMSKLIAENAIKTTSFISAKNDITEEYAEPFLINSETDNILINNKIYYYYFTNQQDFKSKEKTGFSLQKQIFESCIVAHLINGFTTFARSKRDFYEQISRKEELKLVNSGIDNIEAMYALKKSSLEPNISKKCADNIVILKFKYMELSKLEYAKELLVTLPIMTHISSSDKKLYNKIIIEVDQKISSLLNIINKLKEELNNIVGLNEIVDGDLKQEDIDFTNVDIEKEYDLDMNYLVEKEESYEDHLDNDINKDEYEPTRLYEDILLHPDYIGLKKILLLKYSQFRQDNPNSNLSFLKFLQVNYSQYVVLIEYEEAIEKRNIEICRSYIEYFDMLEDKSVIMSINDYAKYLYGVIDFEVPLQYQERIENLTAKSK